jgi:hypothetical protein
LRRKFIYSSIVKPADPAAIKEQMDKFVQETKCLPRFCGAVVDQDDWEFIMP